eukprot:jgi/Picsp_1/3993/NSC_01505-R1_ankyrin repeat and zinc finger domain-containing protein 1-like
MAKPVGTIFSLRNYIDLEPIQIRVNGENEGETSANVKRSEVDTVAKGISQVSIGEEIVPSKKESIGSITCVTCGIRSFVNVEEQRSHFKSDWHRFNVKLKCLNKPYPVQLEKFDALVEGDSLDDEVGSISGSDSDEFEDFEDIARRDAAVSPYFVFQGKLPLSGTQESQKMDKVLGVWKCLVAPNAMESRNKGNECIERVKKCGTLSDTWAVILYRGGHFALCFYEIVPPSDKILDSGDRKIGEIVDLSVKDQEHKSFHRYVVRAKSGGKQSTKDATGKFARSAGSRLRRYNELALQKEVVETLTGLKYKLQSCTYIFVSAPGSNWQILFSGEEAPLGRGMMNKDVNVEASLPNIVKIPFVTRRPTISETKRVARTLLTLYDVGELIEEIIEKQNRRIANAAPKTRDEDNKRLLVNKICENKLTIVDIEQEREEQQREKRKEKKARQKERRANQGKISKEQGAISKEGDATPKQSDLDADIDIDEALMKAALEASTAKREERNVPKKPQEKLSKASSVTRVNSKKTDDISVRRERLAAAAEARAKALKTAAASQQLW